MKFGEMKRNTSNWSNFCMLLRRAGLTASAGLSCWLLLTFRLRLKPSSESPFAAQFRGEQVVVDVGELVRPLPSVHRLVLLLPDMYRLLDPSVHSVVFSVVNRHRLGLGQSHRGTESHWYCENSNTLFLKGKYARTSTEGLLKVEG